METQEQTNRRMKKVRKARTNRQEVLKDSTYKNLKWMQQRSCVERKSLDEIAEMCKVGYDVIWYALEKLGIPIRIMVTREEYDEYIKKII